MFCNKCGTEIAPGSNPLFQLRSCDEPLVPDGRRTLAP